MTDVKIRAGALLMVFILIFSFHIGFADQIQENEIYQKYDDKDSALQDSLISFKIRLYELGFYNKEFVNKDEISTKTADDDQFRNAVWQVYQLNRDIQYFEEGVTWELYDRVMYDSGSLKTPLVEKYQLLFPGADLKYEIEQIQNRLYSLGYNEDAGFHFTLGEYDDELQRAVDEFVRCNNY